MSARSTRTTVDPGRRLASRRALAAVLGTATTPWLLSACGGGNTEGPADDPVAPSLAISTDQLGIAPGPFSVYFKFSAAPSGFAANRVVLTRATVVDGSFSTISSTEYSLRVRPTANAEGIVQITVPAGNFSDSTGKAPSTIAYSFAQAFDTVVAPNEALLTITDNVPGNGIASGPVTFTLSFSLAIRDTFTAASIEVINGTITNVDRVSGTTYTVVATPPAATSGLMALRVKVGAYVTEGGVANTVESLVGVFFRTS